MRTRRTNVGEQGDARAGVAAALDRVTKRFNGRPALRDVTMSVTRGEILGVVGLNGSGKTTLLRVLVGLIRPDRGTVRVGGRILTSGLACRDTASFAGGTTLPGEVRVRRWARLHGMGSALSTDRRRIRALSRGQRQTVGLRVALARVPLQLVVLDEPWDGLDPDGSGWLMHALIRARDDGAAVVVSSHRLLELASIATRYIVVRDGVVAEHDVDRVAVAEVLRPQGADPSKGAGRVGIG